MSTVIVVGGGAAGLLAAGTAARLGKQVILIEKNMRPARKVMITGKGRCNVTNACTQHEFLDAVVTNSRFLYSAIHQFSPYDTMDLFEKELGVPLKVERGNRVFPISDKAVDIVDALAQYARPVTAHYGVACRSVLIENGRAGGVVLADGQVIKGDSVILATGGVSYPTTGSTGDGHTFAMDAGHHVVDLAPSLIPLVCHTTVCRDLMGLSLKNVTLSVYESEGNRCVYSELGEMLFTHFGVSGPLVLSASAHLRPMKAGKYYLTIDMKPGLDEAQMDARIRRDFEQNIHRTFRNSLGQLLPAKMIPVIVKQSGIAPDCKVNQITKEQRAKLVQVMKQFRLPIDGFRPIEEAVVTAGGVDVKEVNPKTMESKLVEGLYFAGELLDLDAYTGGFNLQIAFSTGYLAGYYA